MEIGKYARVDIVNTNDIVSSFKIRAIQVGVPDKNNIECFEGFIEEILAPNGVNHILLCLDYQFRFKTHPEITDEPAQATK